MALTKEDLQAIHTKYANPEAQKKAVAFAELENGIMEEIHKLKAKLGLDDLGEQGCE